MYLCSGRRSSPSQLQIPPGDALASSARVVPKDRKSSNLSTLHPHHPVIMILELLQMISSLQVLRPTSPLQHIVAPCNHHDSKGKYALNLFRKFIELVRAFSQHHQPHFSFRIFAWNNFTRIAPYGRWVGPFIRHLIEYVDWAGFLDELSSKWNER